ncbi:MAG TPA: IS1380 family transposase, partial [Pseudolabrys sp.]|nr:IS1380 family transposase [Pseudolabrys sp.]
ACFKDGRDQDLIEHSLETLIAQRVHAITLGYEDLNDHDELRHDPVLGLISGKLTAHRSGCAVLAGKSTLNRLEHAPSSDNDRYRKIGVDEDAMKDLFVSLFIQAHRTAPGRLILDLDATDDPIHGDQEGRFFHGYYKCYCYLPLYIFCGRELLAAKLRPANIDASAGAKDEIAFIVARLREKWPDVDIWLRADSGFCREDLMAWCEANGVNYVFGLARNARLEAEIASELAQAEQKAAASGKAERVFKEFQYQTRASWSKSRRVVAKAEHLAKGANPRFIVTSLTRQDAEAQELYEKIYCARGEMENRIKECQLDLMADRTSAATLKANQLRLWFSSLAYVLITALRRLALKGTELQEATAGTIRLKLLKLGALVTVSVRRIKIAIASASPLKTVFAMAHTRLCQAAA